MIIKCANIDNLDEILNIYKEAREYMALNGNKEQWGDNYPSRELIEQDIAANKCYIAIKGTAEEMMNEPTDEKICGVFYFAIENDPMYNVIEQGRWLNDNQYAVVHRIAVSRNTHNRGIAGNCLDYVFEICEDNDVRDLRMDTHKNNEPMQHFLEKKGFINCGIVFVEDGSERLAYHKIIQ